MSEPTGGLKSSIRSGAGPEIKKLVPNVHAFISRAAKWVGRFEEDRASQRYYCDLVEGPINSPIEQLFYVAVRAISVGTYEDFNPNPGYERGEVIPAPGIYLTPQVPVGRYTVDFVLTTLRLVGAETPQVVIELDGHEFHDKDKKQRAYEKARDRFLVKQGYKVLHFTGSEVVADPFAVAHEAMEAAGIIVAPEYDPADPMGCGL